MLLHIVDVYKYVRQLHSHMGSLSNECVCVFPLSLMNELWLLQTPSVVQITMTIPCPRVHVPVT